MGKALAKQITGMSWTAKISLVLLCTVLTSVFMYEGLYKPRYTEAAVGALNAWVNLSGSVPALASGTYAAGSITPTAGTNRVLMVAVAVETSAAATMTSLSATVGGVALTSLKTTAGNSRRSHIYVGYLLNASIPATASVVSVTYNTGSTATVTGLDVKWASYSGVDQTTPFSGSIVNYAAATSVTFGTAITYPVGSMAFLIGENGGTPATITNPTGFTSIAAGTSTAYGQSSFASQSAVTAAAGTYAATLATTFAGTTAAYSSIVVGVLNPVAAPTVTSVAPTSIVSGTATAVTINGTNLTGATITYTNGTVGTVTSNSGTAIVVPVTGSTVGAGTLTVTTTGGSATGSLAVTAAVPTISSISPTSMFIGATSQTLTITGTNLTGATLAMSGTGVTLGTATVTATSITVPVTVAATATAGSYTLTVTTAGGSATSTFTVATPAPTITSVTPSSVVSGTATSVTIVGTNLTGATVAFSNGTAGTPAVTATSIVVSVTGSTATTGTVSVTTAGGTVTSAFTVTAAPVNPTTVGVMTFPTLTATTVGVKVAYTGDSNANNTCVIKWGTVSGTYPNTLTATKGSGFYTATATGLTLGVTYYFQATFTDADGVTGTNPAVGSAVTSDWTNSNLLHNSANTGSTKWAAGWGIPGGQYGAFTCSTCHNQTTTNIKRIAAKFPAVFAPATTVNFKSVTTPNGFGDDTVAHATSNKVCEVCHTMTKYHNRNSAGSTSLVHNNNLDCTTCHAHNNGFAALGACDSCHGNPPTTATSGGPTGLATNALPSGQAGAHAIHVTTEGFKCNLCHNGSATTMPSGALEIGFAINPTNAPGFAPTITTGAYVGNSAMTGTTWASSSTGTTVTTAAGVNTCNVYCHGATLLSGATANPVASWVAGATERACGSCHGVTSAAVPGAVGKTNSHTKHVGTYNFACTKCHKNAGTAASVNYAHIDGAVQWRLSTATTGMIRTGATYNGAVSGSTTAQAGSTTYGSCATLHCHSDGTFIATGAALTAATAPSATWGTTLTCAGCHGNPPSYTNLSPKGNSHQGATHLTKTCDYCHDSVTYNATTLTYTPVVGLHANGAYNVKAFLGYSANKTIGAGLVGGSCSTSGCHGKASWGGSAPMGCIDCHASQQLRTKGRPGTYLAAVKTEFGLAWGHKNSTRAAVTDADCIVCHLEGNYTTQKTSSYHQDGNIDLRNPDGVGEVPITNMSGAAWTFQRFSTSYAAGSRVANGQTLNNIDNVISQKFCLACHDGNGATNTTARTPGGTAAMPFGGINLGTNYTTLNGAIAAGGTINVFSQFSSGNASRHPVRKSNTKDFPYSTRLAAPYNNIGTARDANAATGHTTALSVVINCFDCHNTATTPLTRRTVAAHGNAVTLRGAIYAAQATLCTTCHIGYTVTGTHSTGSAWSATGSSHNASQNCHYCHGSNTSTTAPVRPVRAQDYHGNNALVGGGKWSTGSTRPYAFIRGWTGTAYHRPYRSSEFTTGSATCGAGTCPGGGQVGDGSTRTYTAGGTY